MYVLYVHSVYDVHIYDDSIKDLAMMSSDSTEVAISDFYKISAILISSITNR